MAVGNPAGGSSPRSATDNALTVRVRCGPGHAALTATGEIDIATVARLRERLFTLADEDPGNRAAAGGATPRLPAEPRHTAHRGSRPGYSWTGSTTSFRRANQGVHGGLKRA